MKAEKQAKRMLKIGLRLNMINLMVLGSLSFILASETEHGSAGSIWLDFASKIINFLILFGGLGYFLYRPLKQWLHNKTLMIAHLLEENARARKEAEEKLASVKERWSGLDKEIEALRKKAEVEGLREKERILSLAREEAARIEKLRELEIEALRQGAIRELKAYAAGLAAALAETRIRQKLNPELHRRLIRRSIERLAKLDESPSTG